jgi:hypothetical protein
MTTLKLILIAWPIAAALGWCCIYPLFAINERCADGEGIFSERQPEVEG